MNHAAEKEPESFTLLLKAVSAIVQVNFLPHSSGRMSAARRLLGAEHPGPNAAACAQIDTGSFFSAAVLL
jgi:hypothetical protein